MDEITLLAFLATLIGLITAIAAPILKLDRSITRNNVTLENLRHELETLNHRLDVYNERIEELARLVTEHEVKIDRLSEYHKIK